MMNLAAVRAWQRRQYEIRVDNPTGRLSVDGIVMADVPIGMHFRDAYGIDVTHIPSGLRIGRLTTMGAALDFCHRIAHLCDWTKMEPEMPMIVHDILRTIEAGACRPKTL